MTNISRVKRCVCLAMNTAGRDLVVGDLHGHRSLLERELERLDFDPSRDRLFSVGDLIDRGPESLATLELIEQPWFHAVLGNHELMLLGFLGCYDSRLKVREAFAARGGQWIHDALASHRRRVLGLADRLADLPMAIHVDGRVPFNVTHGDLLPIGSRQDDLTRKDTISVHKAERVTSSRDNLAGALKAGRRNLRHAGHDVQISAQPLGDLAITYVGHTPVRLVTVHNSHVYIEQGVGQRSAARGGPLSPTVLAHAQFAGWLVGVAAGLKAEVASGRVTAPGPSGTLALTVPSWA